MGNIFATFFGLPEKLKNVAISAQDKTTTVWSAPDIAGIEGTVVYLGIATIFLMK